MVFPPSKVMAAQPCVSFPRRPTLYALWMLTFQSFLLGWWLAKKGSGQAWVPASYVEEQKTAPPPPVAPRPPPPPPSNGTSAAMAGGKPKPVPPAKRPAAGRKPAGFQAQQQPRDSAMSLNGGNDSSGSRSNTPTPGMGMAGGLAEALLARKNAMQQSQRRDDDDDW